MATKKTTIHDIAKKLDITASTVSRALKDNPNISIATKKRVQATAKKMNYQPNSIAASLRKGTSNLVGVLVPTIDRNFFGSVVRGIEEILTSAGYNVIVSQTNDDMDKEIQGLKALLEAQVDCIFISMAKKTTSLQHFQEVINQGIPLILFDRQHQDLTVDSVVIDDYQGAFSATKHLIDQGCKRIVHFNGSLSVSIYKDRLRGYQDALRHNNIDIDENLIFLSELKLQDGHRIIKEILDKNLDFDGIFSVSDYAAMGAMEMLKNNGYTIPQDIAIVGFSNEDFTRFVEPSLTTVDQHSKKMGQICANLFLKRSKEPDTYYSHTKTVLPSELIIRKSSQKISTLKVLHSKIPTL